MTSGMSPCAKLFGLPRRLATQRLTTSLGLSTNVNSDDITISMVSPLLILRAVEIFVDFSVSRRRLSSLARERASRRIFFTAPAWMMRTSGCSSAFSMLQSSQGGNPERQGVPRASVTGIESISKFGSATVIPPARTGS